MASTTLCKNISNAIPDAKDRKRAADIIDKAVEHTVYEPGWGNHRINLEDSRSILANKQLKAIKDEAKFYRRCKAFLDRGITIKFSDTIFSHEADLHAREFVNNCVQTAKHDEEIDRILARIDRVSV